jgi:3'-phosphoadenosine 5'-phosphosulfate sulfotransferase (PAPS reductase)/FAD synthetase
MTTVLQYSGGKDSLACLYLLRPRWHEITVAWVNTGAAFPETLTHMERVRKMVPHFHEIKSRQTIETEGYPADVLPVSDTVLGRLTNEQTGPRFQSRHFCCAAAIWRPMASAMVELGAKVIIRGQKNADQLRSVLLVSGTVINGIEYQFPLQDWTDADVYRYLREQGVSLPPNYEHMHTGLDCMNCTAYLRENVGKFDYMRKVHPIMNRQVQGIIAELNIAIQRDTEPTHRIIGHDRVESAYSHVQSRE